MRWMILAALCLVGAGGQGERAPHVVFVTGDCEYRSEISMPMIAKILEEHHGMKCTVLYAVDENGQRAPRAKKDIPGLEALKGADLAVFFLRFRALPDDQLQHILDYADSGKPMVGLRTSTHAFLYPKGHQNADLNDGFGRDVFGQKWIRHHGHANSTRVLLTLKDHPVCRGLPDEWWARSWLYHVIPLHGDCATLAHGYALKGGEESGKEIFGVPGPVAWTKTFTGPSGKRARVFFTTLGHPWDFHKEASRRLLLNGIYWALGREDDIPAGGCRADIVGPYDPPGVD